MRNIRFNAGSVRLPQKVQIERLHRVIREELSPLQRYTVIAYYFQEQSICEIARQRQVSKSTVSRTLRRAENKLRRFLQY